MLGFLQFLVSVFVQNLIQAIELTSSIGFVEEIIFEITLILMTA